MDGWKKSKWHYNGSCKLIVLEFIIVVIASLQLSYMSFMHKDSMYGELCPL